MTSNPTVETIHRIETDLKKSLDEVGLKHGYTLKFGNGKYDNEGNFTLKLECNKDGAKSTAAQLYDRKRIPMRLPPLGTVLDYGIGCRKYTVVGINKTGTKVHCACNGLTYLLPVADVKMIWENMRLKAEKAELMA
jgi:hypothetical protein